LNHVGNDIVDLKNPEAMGKSADTRFVQRILNPDEQQIVLNSDHADRLLWSFWAAKESAYKAVSKSFPDVSSAPRRYPVILDSGKASGTLSGIVDTPHGAVVVKLNFNEDFVHCIGTSGPEDSLKSIIYGMDRISPEKIPGVDSISEKESLFARNLAKKHIASCLQVNEQDVQIIRHKKQNRIDPPMIYTNGKKKNMDLSLSHDGRFGAFAFLTASSV
jgi:phosphopantetheine--protein transferase-like protein